MKLIRHPNEQTCADGALSFKMMALMTGAFAALALTVQASDPSWWSSQGAVSFSASTNDGVMVSQGQVKQFTASAVAELNTRLATNGGAGLALSNLVYGWHQDYITNGYETNTANPTYPYKPSDFTAVNMGELKYVGSLVYGQLAAAGYTGLYPSWIEQDTNADYSAASMGQLKQVFDFDLTASAHAITALTASTSNPGEVDLSWTAPTVNNATSIVINYSTDGGTTWTNYTTVSDPTITSYAVTGLTAGQSYKFQLITGNSVGSSSAVNTSSGSTAAAFSPALVSAYLGATNSVNLTWSEDTTNGVTGYTVLQSTNGGTSWITTNTVSGAGQTNVTLLNSQVTGPLDTSLFQIKATAGSGGSGDSSYAGPITPTGNPAVDTDSDGTSNNVDGWAGFTDKTQEAKLAPSRLPNPTYTAVVISQIPTNYFIDFVNSQGQAVVHDTNYTSAAGNALLFTANFSFWDKGATNAIPILAPTDVPSWLSGSSFVSTMDRVTGLGDDGTVIGIVEDTAGGNFPSVGNFAGFSGFVWTTGLSGNHAQTLNEPHSGTGIPGALADCSTFPNFIKSSNGTNIIYGFHSEWDDEFNPHSSVVTWSSTNSFTPEVYNGVVDKMDNDFLGFGGSTAPFPSTGAFSSTGSHESRYPIQDNGNGTTIGFGATMDSYQLEWTDTSVSPSTNYVYSLDANLTMPSSASINGSFGPGGYFVGQPLTSGGGGMIVKGSYRQWINGTPVAVNSAGAVLGLQNSTTNSTPTENTFPGYGDYAAEGSAPYWTYFDTNNVPFPTIWIPQPATGTPTNYVAVPIIMPQTNLSFTGAPYASGSFPPVRPLQQTMFLNSNMQVAGGIYPQTHTDPSDTNSPYCDLPYLWQNYQYHPLQTFFPGLTNYSSFQVTGIDDAGVVTAIAIPSSGNQKIIQLEAIQFVRETTPGSGDFEPITDNGLDDKARLPIFGSHTGEGTTETETGAYTLNAVLSIDLSSTSTATVNITYSISGGSSYTGTLTETGAGTGIFKDSTNTVVLTLTPSNQTTSSTSSTMLSAQITIPSLSISNQPVTLVETDTLTYQATSIMTDVILAGPLSTTAINSITASFHSPYSASVDQVTLTETGVNTRVFRDSLWDTTLTMTGYTGGTSMNISANVSGMTPTSFGSTLQEIGTSTYQYSNYQTVISTASDSTPATDGQGVFYVQLPGTTTTSLTLVSGSNQVTVSATPVTGQPNLLRTGKLVLIEPGDSFSASGITTLTVSLPSGGGNPTVQLQMNGQTVVDPDTVHDAYLGNGRGAMGGGDQTGLLTPIQTEVENLGWSCPNIHAIAVKSDVLAEIQKYSLFYFTTHGLTPTGEGDGTHTPQPPLQTFLVYKSANPNDRYDLLKPGDPTIPDYILHYPEVASANGNHVYDLVFFNGCWSADTSSGSNAANFAQAFNAQEYVGWSEFQFDITATHPAFVFFQSLKGHQSVQFALGKANRSIGLWRVVGSFLQTLPNYNKDDDNGIRIDNSAQ